MSVVPITEVNWAPCWRIIPSRFPPIDLYARIAPPDDWLALQDTESLTNERLRTSLGKSALVRAEDRLSGPGTSLIMSPFTHPDPNGDQFSDGTFGISYALPTFEAALVRSVRGREEFLSRTKEGPTTLQMRVLNTDMRGMVHDLRGKIANDYRNVEASRELSRNLRAEGSYGLLYDDPNPRIGETLAAFRPTILQNLRQERHLAYKWDGTRMVEIYDFTEDKRRLL
jgi:hypothetical protein